jgi:hypothetical protein
MVVMVAVAVVMVTFRSFVSFRGEGGGISTRTLSRLRLVVVMTVCCWWSHYGNAATTMVRVAA